LQNLADDTQG